MRFLKFIFTTVFALLLSSPGVARADCLNPAGVAGELMFNADRATMQYCNGAEWIAFPKAAGGATCSDIGAWTAHAAAEQNGWSQVVFANDLFVAVAEVGANRVMTSPDGIDWTPHNAPTGAVMIAYGGGLFVTIAGGANGRHVMTSPNGTAWTQHSNALPTGNTWGGVTYGNGQFVAISSNGNGGVATSTNGVTWTYHAGALESHAWWDIAYGNGLFVAVSYTWDATNRVAVSADGVNWTAYPGTSSSVWTAVAYGNGRFVVAGEGGAMYSADGINWTMGTGMPGGHGWLDLAYGNGMFVAVSPWSGSHRTMISTDGINWQARMATEMSEWIGVAYGNGAFVAVSRSGTDRVMRAECLSPGCTDPDMPAGRMMYNGDYRVMQWCDGTHWQAMGPVNPGGPNDGCENPAKPGGNLMFSQRSCSVEYCDGDMWRTVGRGDPCACDPDAGEWMAQVMPASQFWRGIAFGNGMFVAAGDNPASSPDGIDWTVHNTVDLANGAGGHIAFGNGLFVAPSGGGWTRRVSTSPDGVNWTMHDTALPPSWPPTDGVGGIVYGDNQFVIVGGGGAISTSPDGIAWTPRTSGVTTNFSSVTYGNGLYVASGQWLGANPDYPVVISPDGINWTPVPAANVFNAKVTRIDFGNGLFVGKTYQGGPQLIYSTDGVNWMVGDPGNIYSAWNTTRTIYANGRFVTAGRAAGPTTLYSSEDGITWSVLETPTLHHVSDIAYGNGVFVTVTDGTGVMRATCIGGG